MQTMNKSQIVHLEYNSKYEAYNPTVLDNLKRHIVIKIENLEFPFKFSKLKSH